MCTKDWVKGILGMEILYHDLICNDPLDDVGDEKDGKNGMLHEFYQMV